MWCTGKEPGEEACMTVGGWVPGQCWDEEGLPGFSGPSKVRARQPLSPRQGPSSAGRRRLFLPPPPVWRLGGGSCVRSFTAQGWSGFGIRDLELSPRIYEPSLNL